VRLLGRLSSGGAIAGVSGPEEPETDGSAGELGSVGFGAVGVHDGSRGHVRRPRDATQEVCHGSDSSRTNSTRLKASWLMKVVAMRRQHLRGTRSEESGGDPDLLARTS